MKYVYAALAALLFGYIAGYHFGSGTLFPKSMCKCCDCEKCICR